MSKLRMPIMTEGETVRGWKWSALPDDAFGVWEKEIKGKRAQVRITGQLDTWGGMPWIAGIEPCALSDDDQRAIEDMHDLVRKRRLPKSRKPAKHRRPQP